jgi:DNA-binding transcriptional regulator YdaS (Cro superfamily)
MGKDTAHTRTLRRAVEVVGSPERLADTLGVSPESLRAWLAGDQALPNEVYLRALDVVSHGPHHAPLRKPK